MYAKDTELCYRCLLRYESMGYKTRGGLCMRKQYVAVILVVMFFLGSYHPIQGEEENLILDTEELKNKNESSPSLTDINGINLFTTQAQELLASEAKQHELLYKQNREGLFTNQVSNLATEKNERVEQLFLEPISYEKVVAQDTASIAVEPLVFIGMVVLGVSAFFVTRRYYKKKENPIHEINFDIYK